MSEVTNTQAAQSTNQAEEGKTVLTTPPQAEAQANAEAAKPGESVNPNSDANSQEAQPEAAAVPEKYELKLPEGSILKPEHVEQISAFAKEHKLSQELAQKLLERESGSVSSYAQARQAEIDKEVSGWLVQVQNDPEYGGEKFKQNAEYARQFVKKYGDEDFWKALDMTGLGNHPALFRFMARAGKAAANDKAVFAGTTTTPEKKSAAEILYSNPNN